MADVMLNDVFDLPRVPQVAVGLDLVMQRCRTALHTFQGEWLEDVTAGMPFLQWMESKVSAETVAARFLAEILAVPGVLRVDDWTWSQAGVTVSMSGTVYVEDGQTFAVELAEDDDPINAAPWVARISRC